MNIKKQISFILTRFIDTEVLVAYLITALHKLAKKTDNKIDDKIVETIINYRTNIIKEINELNKIKQK